MVNTCDVLILAGGFGTRMVDQFPDLPKPLIPIAGVPVLERQIIECEKYGFAEICVLLHHRADLIKQYLGDGIKYGVRITYLIEEAPLGTGGALLCALSELSETVLVLYADVYIDVDLTKLVAFHNENSADLTLLAHPNSHPHDSDILVLDERSTVIKVSPHPHSDNAVIRNMVNGALYVFQSDVLKKIAVDKEKFDIAQDLLPICIRQGLLVKAYVTVEYLKDMGTPDRLLAVEMDLSKGIPESRSARAKRRCIFLDRDGTINKEVGHLNSVDQLELLDGAASGIKAINKSKFISICISNQPVLARGEMTFAELDRVMCRLDFLLGRESAYLDDFFFCPHHPDAGFPGEVAELKQDCQCRKPALGMFEEAARRYNIDLSNSWMIGDQTSDIRAAANFGGRGCLVGSGFSGSDAKWPTRPCFVASNLSQAVTFLTEAVPQIDATLAQLTTVLNGRRVITISGLSRSGKSTLAANLKWRLETMDHNVHILELDRFLKKNRAALGSAKENYSVREANEVITEFFSNKSASYHDIGYDHNSTATIDYGLSRKSGDAILIIEGVTAQEVTSNFNMSCMSIFVQTNEDERKQRFFKKYENRGASPEFINKLWVVRQAKEDPFVSSQAPQSEFIFDPYSKELM